MFSQSVLNLLPGTNQPNKQTKEENRGGEGNNNKGNKDNRIVHMWVCVSVPCSSFVVGSLSVLATKNKDLESRI